ncbi:MAG: hypothetical protein AAF682_05300 [Planctomycetota bacterium]
MDAPFPADAWTELLTTELGVPVQVSFGSARRNVLVARPDESCEGYRVRMHAGFRNAPPEVRLAVARWLRSGRRASRAARVLDAWIDDVLIPSFAPRRPARCVVAGEHHHLGRLADELRGDALPTELLPPERWPAITWGNRRRTGARRSLHLGTFDAVQNLVRIHAVLDQEEVPTFFVRFVLFHELLHAALPSQRANGRTVHHGAAFRARERAYPDYQRAKAWEDDNIGRLLHSTRTGRDMRPPSPSASLTSFVQRLLFD